MRRTRFAAGLLAAGLFTAAAQETPSPNRLTTEHYFELERISNAQISPDGAHRLRPPAGKSH